MFVCQDCDRTFKNGENFRRHSRGFACTGRRGGGRFQCPHCSSCFTRYNNMNRHVEVAHNSNLYFSCGLCKSYFASPAELKQHRENEHSYETEFALVKSAHRKQAQLFRMHFPDDTVTVDEAYKYGKKEMRKLLNRILAESPIFKVNFVFGVEMYKSDQDGVCTALETFSFRSNGFTVSSSENILEGLKSSVEDFDRNIGEFLFQGSGWKILRPFTMDAELAEVNFLSGGAGGKLHIASYMRRRGIVPDKDSAVLQDDGYCFYSAVAAGVLGSGVNYGELCRWFSPAADKFGPHVKLKDIGKIEHFWRSNTNFKRLSINVVYKDERSRVMPVRAGVDPLSDSQVSLLLSYAGEEQGNENETAATIRPHYSVITDANALFARRQRSSTGRMYTTSRRLCWNCLNTYYDQKSLKAHLEYCRENNCQRIIMPEPGATISYREKSRRRADGTYPTPKQNKEALKAAYVLYFDFEALHMPPEKVCSCPPEMVERRRLHEEEEHKKKVGGVAERVDDAIEAEMLSGEQSAELESEYFHLADEDARRSRRVPTFPKVSKERKRKMCSHKSLVVGEQQAFSYSYCLMDREGNVLETKAAHGKNCVESFLQDVLNISETYMPNLTPGKRMREMTAAEKERALTATHCYLCKLQFDEDDRNKSRVLDHDHLTGDFLGVAHNICNLHRREDYGLTCFSHNFSGYDSHFIIKALSAIDDVHTIKAIPLNTQKFKCVTLNNRIKFLDSAAFLNATLADCAETLVKSDHSFELLDSICDSDEQKRLLLRKGVYPYSFATSLDKLVTATKLPAKEAFYNELTEKHVSEEDYAHAQKVWRTFNISNMMEYTTLYLRTDTLLLAEAMTELRDTMYRDFKLDLTRYLSLPMLAKDIMLKTTGVELELMSDHEMSHLVQKNLRGGLSFINKRKAEKLEKDEEGGPRSLVYTDCTNLYGKAMCMPLPIDNFQWLSEKELAAFSPQRDISTDSETGYFLEVDLEYPEELHKSHNSFPLAAQTLQLTEDDLSPYSYSCLRRIAGKSKYRATKLTSTFHPRTRYLCHGLNLQLYLQLGMRLVRIHRAVKFRQASFIKPYIEMCSERRRTAPTEAQRNMYKLPCNSLYGKLIEGFEKRMQCSFNRTREVALRNSSHPLYKGRVICDEDLSISFHKLGQVKMQQSWAVGFSILELSKYWMQKSYYRDIVPAFDKHGGCTVLMSDTDSFLLETALDHPDEAVKLISHVMDTSNYRSDHRLYSKDRAKVPGYFKNEIPNAVIDKFVGLKSKTYAIQCREGDVEVKAKGVPERQKYKIPVQQMLNCLDEMKSFSLEYNALRSYNHRNKLVKSSKVAFSSFDDKRYLMCEVHSVPYGSRLIRLSDKMKKCYFCHQDQKKKSGSKLV